MVAFTPFDSFIERLAEGEINLQSDTLRVALSNTAPAAASDSVFGDITEISAGNGYTAGGVAVTVASSGQSSGTYTLSLTDIDPAWTASSGTIGPFQYIILYDDTHASDALIGYYDRGSTLTLNDGDSFSLNFAASTLQIAPA